MLLQTEAMANNAQVSFDRLATVNADSAQILGSLKAVENQIAKEHGTAKGVIDDALLDTAARIKDVEDKLASKVRDNAALLSTLEDSTASVSQMQDAIAAMVCCPVADALCGDCGLRTPPVFLQPRSLASTGALLICSSVLASWVLCTRSARTLPPSDHILRRRTTHRLMLPQK
jgi:hypothetical protein